MTLRAEDRAILIAVLGTEGGFDNNPADRGGATNFGVTAETLGDWRHLGRPATVEEVRALTQAEALDILGGRYIEAPGFEDIPWPKLRHLVVDMWVNHGPRNATLIIQHALKLPGDGILGPNTLGKLKEGASMGLGVNQKAFDAILAERIRFYSRVLANDVTQVRFAKGWLDRAADFISPN